MKIFALFTYLVVSIHKFSFVSSFGPRKSALLGHCHHHHPITRRPPSLVALGARRGGAKGRKKAATGFGKATTTTEKEPDAELSSEKIYSLPALYDLAFGYRNFEDEVDFLLHAHAHVVGQPPTRVLELAAGPARHSIQALKRKNSSVESVTALDTSPDMVQYGSDLASAELANCNKRNDFVYLQGDMKSHDFEQQSFDTAWILLGSLQHLVTNADVSSCFQTVYKALTPGGTLVIELPHPRETFSMVECTRNGWEVPLEDENGNECGELQIVWGNDDDKFDPIRQVRDFTVMMRVNGGDNDSKLQSVKQVVPMRQFTAQEIDALACLNRFQVAEMYGALAPDVNVNDDDEAFRLVCVLQKMN